MAHYVLDVKGLLCPMPVIRLGEQAKQLTAGDTVEMHATDPGVKADIPAWCRVHGHTVIEEQDDGDLICMVIEIGE
ncbi:hypothetical protein CAI21_03865 [Alkalilimnicola ehrlichii]|uniref:UPF0033 domain-containing protein n=1 Tax=Alkalilimnicola ehrlichii TaxID=351052 RepID=A0A3E0X1T2_9GAMM|nr:sulfurtransferase TusA family protein [Alkalilimnicola ehrlichii]RFA30662.1 hypothetical protein CAI21_03865 [Alkalilimnicola ehrlichii]RFA38241.1 hypothetical protein CAL65_05235 [Alkalilimnicola ehrlichii]